MPKIAVTDDRFKGDFAAENEVFEEIGSRVTVYNLQSEEEAIESLRDADAVLVGLFGLTGRIIEGLSTCQVISRYGIGYDNIDVDAATKKGIWVARVPDFCVEDVSDHTIALLLGCLRGVAFKDRKVRNGEWNVRAPFGFSRMTGKTLGFVGFGNISQAVVRKLQGFALGRVLAFDPFVDEETMRQFGVAKVDLRTVVAESDYLSIHVPLTSDTKGLLDGKTLAHLKQDAILVNTSRGPVIDEEALARVLQNGNRCAALDVFEIEPLPENSPLRDLDNVIFTDHNAWYSRESLVDLKIKTARNALSVLNGGTPAYPVNDLS
jgi:D-3-phosphoglycerate dehydrogenase / 2-oxoglutarate reductase